MNTQEAFNTMVTHLRKQGKAAQDDSGMCVYKHEDGSQCAVGCLLPDSVYDLSMEGTGNIHILLDAAEYYNEETDMWEEGDKTYPELAEHFKNVDIQMLADMQNVHDHKAFQDWEYHFGRISDAYGLSLPPILELAP